MNKNFNKYIAFYTLSYGAIGAIFPLIGQYFSHLGFNGVQIGTITATATFVSIFATTIWGGIYNQSKQKYAIVALLALLSGACAFAILGVKAYILVLICYAAFYFFQQPLNALSDAMTMADESQPFNKIRMWGAIGYAAFVYIAGKFSGLVGLKIIFIIAVPCLILSALIAYSLRKASEDENRTLSRASCNNVIIDDKDNMLKSRLTMIDVNSESDIREIDCDTKLNTCKHDPEKSQKKSLISELMVLMTNKKYVCLLLCTFFVGGANVANNTYFSFLYTQAGGSLAGVGLTFLLMVGSEAPFMAWSAKLSEKFTLEKMVLFAMIVSALRFGWYSMMPSYTWLTALFFLQGMVNGIILVEFVKYVAKLVNEENLGFAISLYYVVSSGLSGITFQFVGGVMLDYLGGGGVYLFASAFNLIGIAIYLACGLQKAK